VNQATPAITWATPSPVGYGTALSSTQLDATASVPGTFVYSPAAGTTPAIGSDTLSVSFTPTDTVDYKTAGANVTLVVNQPPPVIGSLSPVDADAGGAAFILTINGTGFTAGSTVYWGTTALSTQYVSATQITAAVPASAIAATGAGSVTVENPAAAGGVTSGVVDFEVLPAGSGTPPNFTTISATVAPGATASYPVTLPSTASNVSVSCLNLPTGAACNYSASTGAVTIITSSATPAGTYQIIVVFTATLPGTAPATIFLPILLLPIVFIRKRLQTKQFWFAICLGIAITAATVITGCGGGGGSASTYQSTTAAAVSLTVQ
jgi:hypothetical protein